MTNAVRITPEDINYTLAYFTTNSLLSDDRRIVLVRNINEYRNLCLMDMATGSIRPLTENAEGVEIPAGDIWQTENDHDVILQSSVAVHSQTGKVFYIQGRKVCRTDVNGNVKLLARIPDGMVTANMHVNRDGTKLLVGTSDGRAFKGFDGRNAAIVDHNIQTLGLSAQLRVYDTDTGEELVCENVSRARVTHEQFSPADDNIILYNHEWPSDCGIRRMWLWNGKEHTRVRTEGDGRSREDWTCHEMWEREGNNLIYHGSYKNGPSYIGKATIKDLKDLGNIELEEIGMPKEYARYGHFSVSNTRALVTDGCYQLPDEPQKPGLNGGEWVSIVKPDWEKKAIEWMPLCKHGSSWTGQDSHPHPIFSHAADAIYFNSDREGFNAVYKVDISGLELD